MEWEEEAAELKERDVDKAVGGEGVLNAFAELPTLVASANALPVHGNPFDTHFLSSSLLLFSDAHGPTPATLVNTILTFTRPLIHTPRANVWL